MRFALRDKGIAEPIVRSKMFGRDLEDGFIVRNRPIEVFQRSQGQAIVKVDILVPGINSNGLGIMIGGFIDAAHQNQAQT